MIDFEKLFQTFIEFFSQELLDALDGGDVKKFKSILSRFSDVPHEAVENEEDLEAVYYQVLLNVPRSEEVFDDEDIWEVSCFYPLVIHGP